MAIKFFNNPSEHAKAFLGDLYVSERYVRRMEQSIAAQETGFDKIVETTWEQGEVEIAGGVFQLQDIPLSHDDGLSDSDYNLKSFYTKYFPKHHAMRITRIDLVRIRSLVDYSRKGAGRLCR